MTTPIRGRPLATAAALLLAPFSGNASDYALLSAGLQARVGERTVFGQHSPESFAEYALRGSWRTPLERPVLERWTIGARLLGSVGVFEGSGKFAGVVSAVPVLAVGTADRRYTIDGGAGLALLSEHRYAQQDFGGPLQVALTVGLEGPLYRRLGIAYRFIHYSDAGAYGPHTVGADLHMAGLSYRFPVPQ